MKVILKDLVDIYLGVTHTPKYVNEGVPFLSVKDISAGKINFDDCKYISKEEYDTLSEGARPKIGDMIFCRVGTLGKPIIIPEGTPMFGSFVSLGYLRNKDKNKCDLNYLKYWMYSKSFWEQVESNVKGASQVNLNTGWLSKFTIDLPEIKQQQYRISTLDKCREIIEDRASELQKLDELIKARFVEMFGNPFVTKRWPVKELKEISESLIDGSNVDPEYYQAEGEVLFLRIQNVWRNEFRLDDSVYVTKSVNQMYYDTSLNTGDLLITKIGRYYTKDSSLGRVAVYRGLNDRANYSNNIMRVRLMNSMNSEFVNTLLNLEDYQLFIRRTSKGGTDKRALSKSLIGSYPIIIPPIELQNKFADFVQQVDKSKVVV